MTLELFATVPQAMESLLATELKGFGAQNVKEKRTGVSFSGGLEVAYRACLWSRLANRVLLRLGEFEAPDTDALYGGTQSVRWPDHLDVNGTLAVDVSLRQSGITNSLFAAQRVKDAVVDQFRDLCGKRPSVNVEQPDLRLRVHVDKGRASLSIDLSGDSLHRRGYRLAPGQAPLKENVAAGLLVWADWATIASSGGACVDPMCGSGTIPIEAAWMATDTAPGLARRYFGFLGWRGHEPAPGTRRGRTLPPSPFPLPQPRGRGNGEGGRVKHHVKRAAHGADPLPRPNRPQRSPEHFGRAGRGTRHRHARLAQRHQPCREP